jgi:hypothetical protein
MRLRLGALALLLSSGHILDADALYSVKFLGTLPGAIGAGGVAVNNAGR